MFDELGWSMHGWEATDRTQCPFDPGTPEWKNWQHKFAYSQANRDSAEGRRAAAIRAREAGLGIFKPGPGPGGDRSWTKTLCRPDPTPAQQRLADILHELDHPTPDDPRRSGITHGAGYVQPVGGGPRIPISGFNIQVRDPDDDPLTFTFSAGMLSLPEVIDRVNNAAGLASQVIDRLIELLEEPADQP